jgi:CDP-2,3-bis-(O-geranylgeranyl)-sn-glycerol synthase
VLPGVADVAPIAAKHLLGARWQAPLDGGWRFVDGRPLLGPSKTWRGLLAAATALAARCCRAGRRCWARCWAPAR